MNLQIQDFLSSKNERTIFEAKASEIAAVIKLKNVYFNQASSKKGSGWYMVMEGDTDSISIKVGKRVVGFVEPTTAKETVEMAKHLFTNYKVYLGVSDEGRKYRVFGIPATNLTVIKASAKDILAALDITNIPAGATA